IGWCSGSNGLFHFYPAAGGGVGTEYDVLGSPTGGTRTAGHELVWDSNGFPVDSGAAPIGQGSAFSVGTKYLSETKTAGSTGTTANLLVLLDTSGNVVTPAVSTNGSIGIATATKSNGQTLEIVTRGVYQCVADNTTVVGNLAITGTVGAGRCRDSGQTLASGITNLAQIVGRFLSVATVGNLATIEVFGPGIYGTLINGSSTTSFTGLIRGNGT